MEKGTTSLEELEVSPGRGSLLAGSFVNLF